MCSVCRVGCAVVDGGAPPQEGPECFICTESVPAPLKSECLCTDRHMHTACFVSMLKARGDNKCSVCGAPYGNVRWKTRRVLQWQSPCGLVLCLVLTIIVLIGCTATTAFADPKELTEPFVRTVFSFMLGGLAGALVALAVTWRQRGCREMWATRVREERVFCVGPVPVRVTTDELELGETAA